jgi:hypothetical protein
MTKTGKLEKHRFYKTENGSWYIDLPDWQGSIGELLMVAGADTLLDELSRGTNEVLVELAPQMQDGFEKLQLVEKKAFGGADYILETYKKQKINHEMWLCDVTKFVFNNFPEEIYFRVVE